MSGRRPYMRSMAGWWRRDPFFVRYMIREATALVVAAYAIVLLAGVLALAHGEATWDAWLAALRTPLSIALNLLMLVGMIYHSYSWFDIMPKTMPPQFVGGKRVAAATITKLGWAAAAVAAAAIFAVARILAP
jgi:fumarate reductase subunit C